MFVLDMSAINVCTLPVCAFSALQYSYMLQVLYYRSHLQVGLHNTLYHSFIIISVTYDCSKMQNTTEAEN